MQPANIAVVGAGIVGTACALRLAADGHAVTVFDPAPPGSGCSHGNAAHVGTASIIPSVNPRAAANAVKWMRDPLHPLRVPIAGWPRNLRWILRFHRAATHTRSSRATERLSALLSRAYDDLAPLLRLCGSEDWLDRRGLLHVYGSEAGFEAARPEYELRRRYGIALRYLGEGELHEIEPSLGPRARCGVLLEDVGLISDPGGLAARFMAAAIARGATLCEKPVTHIRPCDGAGAAVTTEAGSSEFTQVILAAGIGSRRFFGRLGVRVPLWAERGYHLQFADSAHGLTRSVLFLDRRVVYSPLAAGLRMTTGAEFTEPAAPPSHPYYRRIFEGAKGLLKTEPDLDEGRPWCGSRPSTPDSLPIIGRSPRLPQVILATGHGHLGLTLAAPTARLVAELIGGGAADPVLAALSPDRSA